MQRGGSLRLTNPTSRSDRLQQRLPITQHFGQNRPLRPSRKTRREEGPAGSLQEEGTPHLTPEDTQDPEADDTLDGSFLGSGEELDLLGEILDSLSTSAARTGGLRYSQSLDNCHLGALASCSSLPDIPASPGWSPENQDPPEMPPMSLPAQLPCLPPAPAQDTASQPPPKANPETTSSSESPRPTQESHSCGVLGPPLAEPQSLILHLSPSQKGADEPRPQERPHSPIDTELLQLPSHLETPQLGVPIELSVADSWTPPPLDSSLQENPKTPLISGALPADQGDPKASEEQRTPRFQIVAASGSREAGPSSRPRVAELKKCFEC